MYAQIVDGAGHVVGNQATPIPVTLDGAVHSIERPLEAIAAEATAEPRLHSSRSRRRTTLYSRSARPGPITFSRIEISLPISG